MNRMKKSYKIVMAIAVPLIVLLPVVAFLDGLFVVRM
jgi:hypothetical protein